VNIDNATFNNVGVTNANLFGVDVAVAGTNLSKTITSIGLKYNSAAVGRAFVFALSGGVNLSANSDATSTPANVPVTVQALANDSGTTGYSLYILSVRPTNGTAIISQRTNVVFTPTLGFVGSGTVGYTITNDVTGSATSLITVTVAAPPRPGVTGFAYLGSKVVLTAT